METKILVIRNVNCSTMTAEEFVKFMAEDLQKASEEYDKIWHPIELERHEKYIESSIQSTLRWATKYAEKTWKREKRRQQFIDEELTKVKESKPYFTHITYFDMKLNPGDNYISDCCILRCNNITEEALKRCYNHIKDNKYFLAAKGWILEDHHNSRPQIKMILSEELEKEYKHEEEVLCNAISNFYRGCKYFGD